jgi:hypothetical protein
MLNAMHLRSSQVMQRSSILATSIQKQSQSQKASKIKDFCRLCHGLSVQSNAEITTTERRATYSSSAALRAVLRPIITCRGSEI